MSTWPLKFVNCWSRRVTCSISDLHVWQVGPEARAAIVSVVAAAGVSADNVRERLAPVHELSHLTVEYRNA